jgi:uncharacterized protein involved in exopolysaccharide biosynthesis
MASANNKKKDNSSDSILGMVMFRYVPYWPLFLILFFICGAGAYLYLNYYAIPLYQSTATILVKDQKKGVEESKTLESLNATDSKTIVENELKVINSRTLADYVVKTLFLYAPVFEEGKIQTTSAYVTSPIVIQAQNTDEIIPQKDQIYFTYNKDAKKVIIGANSFPLDSFVKTPFGTLKFSKNLKQQAEPVGPLFFMLNDARKTTDGLVASLRITAPDKVSSIINLAINTDVPRKGKDILNELISGYTNSAVKDKEKLTATTLEFLDNRIRAVEASLDNI